MVIRTPPPSFGYPTDSTRPFVAHINYIAQYSVPPWP